MVRNLAIAAFLILGGLAGLLLNLPGGHDDPSLSRDPDAVDAYGGTVLVAGTAIDLPPPGLQPGEAMAGELGQRLRRQRLPSAELGEPDAVRELAKGRVAAWYDRATAIDPDRAGRRISVHLVAVAEADGAVREVLAVASGGRVVQRW